MNLLGMVSESEGSLYGAEVYYLGNILCGSLPFALILLFAIKYSIRRGADPSKAALLTTMAFFGSFIFVFSGTYFAHMLSGLFFLLAFLMMEDKRYLLAGLFAGLSFLSEYTIALVFPVWFLQVLFVERKIKPAIYYATGLLPALVFIMGYNFFFTGSPFEMLYKYHAFQELHSAYGFSFPTAESLWGLSLSPYRGIFVYAPVLLIFLLMGLFSLKKENLLSRFLSDFSIPVSLLFFLLIAGYFGWHGGWTYGPRLLFPVAVVLIARSIPFLVGGVRFVRAMTFGGIGLVLALIAKSTHVYSLPTDNLQPIKTLLIPSFLNAEWNGNDILSMILGSATVWSLVVFVLLFIGALFFIHNYFSRT